MTVWSSAGIKFAARLLIITRWGATVYSLFTSGLHHGRSDCGNVFFNVLGVRVCRRLSRATACLSEIEGQHRSPRMNRRARSALMSVLCVAIGMPIALSTLPGVADAQVLYGSIVGNVRDQTG